MSARPPLIVIGMHRSGTSMVTRLLEQMGLFVGWRKQSDHEALFFLSLNQWLFSMCGGAWERPEAIRDLLDHPEARRFARDYLEVSLRSGRALSFLGVSRWLRQMRIPTMSEPWGWKDPRTTFTLPLWLDLFPDAKVLHVYRHGVDVAQSLRRRQELVVASRHKRFQRLRRTYWVRGKQAGPSVGLRCASLAEGFALWESYVRVGQKHVRARGDLGYEISYESFLSAPARTLADIARFCELDVDMHRCERAVKKVRIDRALAYESDPELVAFAEGVKDRLGDHGY